MTRAQYIPGPDESTIEVFTFAIFFPFLSYGPVSRHQLRRNHRYTDVCNAPASEAASAEAFTLRQSISLNCIALPGDGCGTPSS